MAAPDGGLLDLESELTCSICTDLLYSPLTLLDCLHSFCGSCLKEWFAWQATANARKSANPYTCPSCRESVRDTKVDWRLTTLLEGFLKANPGSGKSQEERDEANKQYKPGDNVIPTIEVDQEDSEDERLMASVRELSMAGVDPDTARRRAERASTRPRHRTDRPTQTTPHQRDHARYGEIQRDNEGRHVEHQPSLRSLLSDSEISSADVQQEILQSIYSEGLLNGIDVDNLTPQQEEELTERIADAYRRRQRNRDRSRNREVIEASNTVPRSQGNQGDRASRRHTRSDSLPPQQSQDPQSRARPPISRPHLFEQSSPGADRNERRSASSSGHTRRSSGNTTTTTTTTTTTSFSRSAGNTRAPPARSATDLSQTLHAPEQRPRASSSNARSTTDPSNLRNDVRRIRGESENLTPATLATSSRSRSRDSDVSTRQTGTAAATASAPRALPPPERSPPSADSNRASVRPAASTSAFAPEPVAHEMSKTSQIGIPAVACSSCGREHIETSVHYHCSKCDDGNFNLCKQCYRSGKGCRHWFGFGFMAMHNWESNAPPEGYPRGYERPHVFAPRRYTTASLQQTQTPYPTSSSPTLQEGAFCDSCSTFSNDCYWYCEFCLTGSWGFCNPCILRGHHCTHPLLPLAHISALGNFSHDPSTIQFLPVPHLKDHSYVLRPILTDCDICHQEIHSASARFHCYTCNTGDYDICTSCYEHLIQSNKISTVDGPHGRRRCLQGHRMAVVGYRETPYGGGQVRITLSGPVGGWRLKDDSSQSPPPPHLQNHPPGHRHLATWSWFPAEDSKDELVFPQGGEITECEELNEDWAVGVYAGKVGVFPKNHTSRI